MSTIKPWKELEKQFYRVNVGESSEEILNNPNTNPSYINYTTDNNIIFNGINYSAYNYIDETNEDYIGMLESIYSMSYDELVSNNILNGTNMTIPTSLLYSLVTLLYNPYSKEITLQPDTFVQTCLNAENWADYILKYHNSTICNSYIMSYITKLDFPDAVVEINSTDIPVKYNYYNNSFKHETPANKPYIEVIQEYNNYTQFSQMLDIAHQQFYGISSGNKNGFPDLSINFRINYNYILSDITGLKYLSYSYNSTDYISEYLSLTDENLNLLSYVKEYRTSYTPIKQSNVSLQSLNIYLESTAQPSTLPDAINDIQKLKTIVTELISSLKKSGTITVS